MYQPTHRDDSWRRTILDQRQEINDLIEDSISLANHFHDNEWLQKAWQRGVQQAAIETGIQILPQEPIWTATEIREKDFFAYE